MSARTYKIATSYPPYSREITVKTLCQMETAPSVLERKLAALRDALETYARDTRPVISKLTDASLNIAKHRCS